MQVTNARDSELLTFLPLQISRIKRKYLLTNAAKGTYGSRLGKVNCVQTCWGKKGQTIFHLSSETSSHGGKKAAESFMTDSKLAVGDYTRRVKQTYNPAGGDKIGLDSSPLLLTASNKKKNERSGTSSMSPKGKKGKYWRPLEK